MARQYYKRATRKECESLTRTPCVHEEVVILCLELHDTKFGMMLFNEKYVIFLFLILSHEIACLLCLDCGGLPSEVAKLQYMQEGMNNFKMEDVLVFLRVQE